MAVILIVEDEEQVRVLTESFLQSEGHETVSAATADEALAALAVAGHVDLLFTDLSLHSETDAGLDLAKRAARQYSDLKVLYTTGQGVTDGMIAMFVPGSALLPKPYTLDQLQKSLEIHFGIKSISPDKRG